MKTIKVAAEEVLDSNNVLICKGLKYNDGQTALVAEPLGLQVEAPVDSVPEESWQGMCPALYAVESGTVQATLPAVKLKGEYRSGVSALTLEDTEAMTTDYLATLESLHSNAVAIGAYIQPVMAKISIIGTDGTVLYSGMPTLVCPPVTNGFNGLMVTRTVQYDGGNYQAVTATPIVAKAFRIGIKWPNPDDSNWQRVSHICINVSPQIQICDFNSLCPTRLSHYLSTAATLEVGMPGVALGADPTPVAESPVINTLVGFKEVSIPLATIYAPSEMSVYHKPSGLTMLEERRLITKLNGTSNSGPDLTPGCYTAKASATNGNIRLLGNLSFLPNSTYSPLEMSQSTTDTPWQASIRVSYGDVRQDQVTVFEATNFKAETLGPLISVPDAAATHLTIVVGTDLWNIRLTPTTDGMHAYAFNIQGFTPSGTGQPEAVSSGNISTDTSLLVATDLTGNALTYTRLHMDIIAITPARNAGGGLQFGQVCFYVFTMCGIYVARLNSAQNRIALAQIDRRGVHFPDCVVETSYGTLAVASNNLVYVHGNRVDTLKTNVEYRNLVWVDNTEDLWITDGFECLIKRGLKGSVRHPGFNVDLYKRMGPSIVYQSNGQWYTPSNIVHKDTTVDISWCAEVVGVKERLKMIEWHFTASRFKGQLQVFGINATDPALSPVLIHQLDINGALNHHLLSRILTSNFPVLRLCIVGHASSDANFNGCELRF